MKVDIGVKLLNSPGSKEGFLSSGLSIACLSNSGIWPDSKERLTILVIAGKLAGSLQFNTWPGTGSRWHGLKEVEPMILKSSEDETLEKIFSWQSISGVSSSVAESRCTIWSMSYRISWEADVSCLGYFGSEHRWSNLLNTLKSDLILEWFSATTLV